MCSEPDKNHWYTDRITERLINAKLLVFRDYLPVFSVPRSIKTASFTTRKRTVNTFKTEHLRQYTVYLRPVFGPYHPVLSGAELRAVLYPYRKRAVFARFLQLYGYNTVSRFIP
jgi:hypothetical protein